MNEYTIIPEFTGSKILPIATITLQLAVIGFVVLGYCITSISYFLASIIQLSVIYLLCLYLCHRNYRLHITPVNITVWNLLNKAKQHLTCQIRWKIKRVPWYNTYYVVLYSTERMPIAILKPHWKNTFRLLKLPHYGPLTVVEREYIAFLKNAGVFY